MDYDKNHKSFYYSNKRKYNQPPSLDESTNFKDSLFYSHKKHLPKTLNDNNSYIKEESKLLKNLIIIFFRLSTKQ